MEKRTDIDFSSHILNVLETEEITIHHLKKPNTVVNNVKFTNISGNLVVTGDFGNWIFCRNFYPSVKESGVSDGYWIEKLETYSTQKGKVFDFEKTVEELKRKKKEYIQECKEEEVEPNIEWIEYFDECINVAECGNEDDYKHQAFTNIPDNYDWEETILVESTNNRLKIIFDAFEEVCSRLKK